MVNFMRKITFLHNGIKGVMAQVLGETSYTLHTSRTKIYIAFTVYKKRIGKRVDQDIILLEFFWASNIGFYL